MAVVFRCKTCSDFIEISSNESKCYNYCDTCQLRKHETERYPDCKHYLSICLPKKSNAFYADYWSCKHCKRYEKEIDLDPIDFVNSSDSFDYMERSLM